jgi:hypothetical protein
MSAPRATITLTARLYRITRIRWVNVSRRVVARLGSGRRVPALLRFNDDLDRVTLVAAKRGHYRLALKVALLRAAGVDAGDTITFTLEADPASREPELPAELRRVFQARPHLAARWAAQSLALRRRVVRYVGESDNPETAARRCWIFLDRLAETGRLRAD